MDSRLAWWGWLGCVGCGGALDDPFAGGSTGEAATTTDPVPTEDSSSTTSTGEPGTDLDTSTSTDEPELKLDVSAPDAGRIGTGCEKIDFLFVIDNSGSMLDDQDKLIASFPAFIDAIAGEIGVADYHVMIVDSDDIAMPSECEAMCADGGPWVNHCGLEWPCGTVPEHLDAICEGELGAGIVHPLGLSSSQEHCDFAGGQRYMTSAEPDLAAAFSCAAAVGVSGSGSEQQIGALLGAVSPQSNADGGCNAGFLRDDAILVVTIITDEDEFPSTGSGEPAQWVQSVVTAKAGDPQAVAVLGLVFGPPDYGWPARIGEFVDAFPYSSKVSISQTDWGPSFVETVELVDIVCDGFVPPG